MSADKNSRFPSFGLWSLITACHPVITTISMTSVGARTRPRQLQIVTPEEELENLKNEVGVLRRAVESKSAAVAILRGELQECQREREKFRTLAEQGGGSSLHRPAAPATPRAVIYTDPGRSAMVNGADGTLAQLLSQAKEESRAVRQEATELRCKLHDAQADIKVLREEVQRWRGRGEGRRGSQANTALTQLALQERERFISQMEELSAKCQALEGDVRGLVEEREELVRELDATYHKLHRLNYILNTMLHSNPSLSSTSAVTPPKRIIDLDAIITENRYLQQRLKQAEEEMTLARSNSSKYKSALEKCRTQGSIKLGTSDSLIVTPKQVSELLQEYQGEVGGPAESDLKSLCVALVDALNQRSRALRTQRSANKVLVGRVTELERRLSSEVRGAGTESGQGEVSKDASTTSGDLQLASQELMEGYTAPAGRNSLVKMKEEDASKDPRVVRFLHAVTSRHKEERRAEGDGNARCGVPSVSGNVMDDKNPRGGGDEASTTPVSEASNTESMSSSASEANQQAGTTAPDTIVKGKIESVTVIGEGGRREGIINNTATAKKPPPCTGPGERDALEEIVPLDQLDAYVREVQLERHRGTTQHAQEEEGQEETRDTEKDDNRTATPGDAATSDEDDSSFDLNISDYDSDNDNLDAALQEWQNDCGGGRKGKDGAATQGSGRRKKGGQERFKLWRKEKKNKGSSPEEVELPSALKELLEKATAASMENGTDWT